jgi:hypothetical protein
MKVVSPDGMALQSEGLYGGFQDVCEKIESVSDTLEKAIWREANNEILLEQIAGDIKRATFEVEHGLSRRIRAEAIEELALLRRVRRNTLAEQKKLDEWIDAMFEYLDLLQQIVPVH